MTLLQRCGLVVAFLYCIVPLGWTQSLASSDSYYHTVKLENYFKETLNTRDGLPHNTINAMAQTADGYIWFGTWEGVARYNGREFTIFDRSPQTGLPDVGIRTFHVDYQNALWIAGSRGGLVRVSNGQWTSFPPLGVLINQVLMDKQQRLWLATEGQGIVLQYPDGQRQQLTHAEGLPSLQIKSLAEDQAGNIWIGTMAGLVVYDAAGQIQPVLATELMGTPIRALLQQEEHILAGTERGLFRLEDAKSSAVVLIQDIPVSALLIEKNQTLWIGTVDRGVLRLANGYLEQLNVRHGLPNNRVMSLLQDKEQSIWVGTNGGVFRLRDAPFTTLTTEQGVAGNFVRAVLSHSNGCMYIGTSHGLTESCNGMLKKIDLSKVSPGQSVLSLAEGLQGSIWVGTTADGAIQLQSGEIVAHFHASHLLPSNEVRAILPLADGSAWFGTAQGAVFIQGEDSRLINREHGLPSAFIMGLYHAEDGRIFIGTGAGVTVLETSGQLTTLPLADFDDAEYAFGFAEDRAAGLLWMTTDRGLLAFDLQSAKLSLVGRQHGMPFDKLFQLVIDQQGYLWISSNRGVLRLNRQHALEIVAGERDWVDVELFGESDGMASAQANGSSALAATLHHDGSVWIATSMGVSWVQPQRLRDFARRIPPVVIEQFLVDNQKIAFNEPQSLAAGSSRIEIRYAGLGFIMPQRIQYRTLLDGFDHDWITRGSGIVAEYTNLPPGAYRFRVAAAYPGGDWSQNEAILEFEIQPHLWQQAWFKVLMVLSVAMAILLIGQWRIRRLQDNELRLIKRVEEQTAELQLLARQDALTGLANRRAFDEALQHEYQRAQRTHKTFCLALIDIDHFKRVNDRYSHAIGDEVLKRTAQVLAQQCRSIDTLARWGGEEFALLMPDTSLEAAKDVCERLWRQVEAENYSDIEPDLKMTISIGLTASNKLKLSQLLTEADHVLYQAKREGRNRIVVAKN